jgi:hypothetical protein
MHKKYVTSAVVALALLAGCGGSDSKESSASETPAAASDAPKAETTDAPNPSVAEVEDTTPEDTTAISTEDTFPPLDTAAPVDTDFSGEGSGDFCGLLTELEESADPSDSIGDPTAASEDVKADFEQFNAIFGQLEDKAPDEIKGDVQVMSKAFETIEEFYARFDYDAEKFTTAFTEDPALIEEYTATLGALGDVEAASTRLDAYSENVCGILAS